MTSDVQTDDFGAVEVLPDSTGMDLRPGTDNYYKYTACGVSCPVAEVDDGFPGLKFQGPGQWRLKRKEDEAVDNSIMSCSNCMRCDSACPSGVLLSQMHNMTHGKYVDEQMNKLSREYIRNRIPANHGTLTQLGSMLPRLINAVVGNSVVQRINKKVFGIATERDFPEFVTQMFREWWNEHGGPQVRSNGKRVAYSHGCYSNYDTSEVGKAVVHIFESFGYEAVVSEQRCSGTPVFADGMLDDTKRAAGTNIGNFTGLVPGGYDIIVLYTSCSISLRQEYPEPFDIDNIEDPSAHTYEALEYLCIHKDLEDAIREASVDDQAFAYHAPCHGRNQDLDWQVVELFRQLDGVEVGDVGGSCSDISGTYSWKEEKYNKLMQIDTDMFNHMKYTQGSVGMTRCPTCSMQMEHGMGYDIKRPLQLLEEALV